MNPASAPIGVFDSGLGGLTVLKALLDRLPDERFVYVGDTARLPYGTKSRSTIRRYLQQNVEFLLKRGVKAIVVACNSASSALEPGDSWSVPLYEVIGPGSRSALAVTKNRRVAVLATRATVAGGAYPSKLQELSPGLTVFQEACPLLVPIVEEGMEADPLARELVRRHSSVVVDQAADTVILGCTHYPVLGEVFRRMLGDAVTIVDSSRTLADELQGDLRSGRVAAAADGRVGAGASPRVELLVTDLGPRADELAARFLAPHGAEPARLVDLG
ncbi:MAG: glutamate racemase [Bdellovibrionales bacterium]|nr:glutamate racemase [Bdellovibrionales bacterium]